MLYLAHGECERGNALPCVTSQVSKLDTLLCLGMCLRDKNRLQDSAETLKKAIDIDPKAATSFIELGRTLMLSQNMEVWPSISPFLSSRVYVVDAVCLERL